MPPTNPNQLMPPNPLAAIFAEYNNCPQHRGIVLSLSSTLQVITMTNPSALVWNNLGEGKVNSPYCGSPIDILPCSPSSLPMPPSDQNAQVFKHVFILFILDTFTSFKADLREGELVNAGFYVPILGTPMVLQ